MENLWLIDLYCLRFLVNHGSSCSNVFTYVIGQNVTKPQFSCTRTVFFSVGGGVRMSYDPKIYGVTI